jgi:hypothetical protein
MLEHAQNGSHRPLGEPMFSMRVVEGFLGTDPDNPLLTPDDGWRRSPTLTESEHVLRDETSNGNGSDEANETGARR